MVRALRRAVISPGTTALLVGAFLFGALFLPDLLRGRIPAYRDAVYYHIPISRCVGAELRAGRLPFWNPAIDGGAPLLANPNNYALYPSRALDLVFPPDTAITIHFLAHWILGGFAFALLLSRSVKSSVAQAGGTAVYMLAGSTLSLLNFANLAPYLLWIPATIHLFLSFMKDLRPRSGALLAGAFALQTTFAEPAMALQSALLCAFAWAFDSSPHVSHRVPWARAATASALAAGLFLLLAAPMVFPLVDLLRISSRAVEGEAALGSSLSPIALLQFPIPQFFGDYHTLEKSRYWGELFNQGKGPFFLSISLGTVAIVLAILGFASRGRRGLALLIPCGLAMLLSMGPFVPLVFEATRGIVGNWARWPVKFSVTIGFGAAVAAAWGLDALVSGRARRAVILAVLIAVAASGAFAVAGVRLRDAEVRQSLRVGALAPLVESKDVDGILGDLSSRFLRAALFAAASSALLGAFAVSRRAGPRAGPVIGGAFVALLLFELVPPQRSVYRAIPVEALRRRTPVLDEARRISEASRRVLFPPEHWEFQLARRPDLPDEWWPRIVLDREIGNFYHPIGEGIRMAFVNPDRLIRAGAAERGRFAQSVQTLDASAALQDLMSVGGVVRLGGFAIDCGGDVHETISGWPVAIERRPGAFPVPLWTSELPTVSPEEWSYDYVLQLRRRVEELRREDAIAIRSSRPGAWQLSTTSDRDGWVLLGENLDPGWSARVDGRAAAIQPYFRDFMAVRVPAGQHDVEWTYGPRGWRLLVGAWAVGAAAFFVCVTVRPRSPDFTSHERDAA